MADSLPLHVVIADADPSVRFTVRAAVEKLDHLCSVAETTSEALEILEQDPPGLLITPWRAPELDGGALIRQVRSGESYVYVVVLTTEAGRLAREAGADEVVAGPLEGGEVEGLLISARRVLTLHAELRAGVRTDPLTELPTRRALSDELTVMRLRAFRYSTELAAVIFDIDRFTTYNEAAGRPAGDTFLRRLSDTLLDSLRASDSLYRHGGGQFLALLPDQDRDSATVAAERLRATVEELAFPHPAGGLVTISAGVAGLHEGESSELFTTRVERALGEAKEAGGNCVRAAESWPHVRYRAQ